LVFLAWAKKKMRKKITVPEEKHLFDKRGMIETRMIS
jgi:hypothetical protein